MLKQLFMFFWSEVRIENAVLTYLEEHPKSTARQIELGTDVATYRLYPALYRLEHEQRVINSEWEEDRDGQARHRLYTYTR